MVFIRSRSKKIKINHNKIKINIISPYIHSLFNRKCEIPYGGAEIQLYLLSKELLKNNYFKIDIITGHLNKYKKLLYHFKTINIHSSLPLKKRIINYILRPLTLSYKLIKLNPDVVIQRAIGVNSVICCLYCRFFNKKFIYSIAHDNEVLKGKMISLEKIIQLITLKYSHFLIAQSRYQISCLKHNFENIHSKIILIRSSYIMNEKRNNNKDYILWVGRAVQWKRGEIFIDLAKNFSNEKFIMICRKGEDLSYWNKLKKRCISISNLEFLNFVPFHNIDSFFNRAKVFINTSTREGFPNTFIQSLKNATPIISLNVDPDNFLRDNQCGFNCDNEISTMKLYLNKLLEDKDLFNKFSKNARNYILKKHDIKKNILIWKNVIRKR